MEECSHWLKQWTLSSAISDKLTDQSVKSLVRWLVYRTLLTIYLCNQNTLPPSHLLLWRHLTMCNCLINLGPPLRDWSLVKSAQQLPQAVFCNCYTLPTCQKSCPIQYFWGNRWGTMVAAGSAIRSGRLAKKKKKSFKKRWNIQHVASVSPRTQ